jgi:hypothetical protein
MHVLNNAKKEHQIATSSRNTNGHSRKPSNLSKSMINNTYDCRAEDVSILDSSMFKGIGQNHKKDLDRS